jgi:ABC-type spermidine/putrescine transport system permease subunit II
MKPANLAVKFLLELAAFAAFAYWGAETGTGATAVVLAILAPAAAVAIWSVFAAPRSSRWPPGPRWSWASSPWPWSRWRSRAARCWPSRSG